MKMSFGRQALIKLIKILNKLIGTNDISNIGDGTITGAISSLSQHGLGMYEVEFGEVNFGAGLDTGLHVKTLIYKNKYKPGWPYVIVGGPRCFNYWITGASAGLDASNTDPTSCIVTLYISNPGNMKGTWYVPYIIIGKV